ncbi:ABC transporter permease [Blastococcus sp. Marseille-P5729]|uniref:ABC transporter permease n=1 Tax=Blastococcus sp. Marseille-P5729 TaxID=2086582 RepID=UPI000D104164|nr:ABC transporter permease [Blastococcus sp. Marseille-P5729]
MSMMPALVRNEARLFVREPAAIFWPILFPLLLLVVFGLIPMFRDTPPGADQPLLVGYVPTITLMSMCFLALMVMPSAIGIYRERLVLKRLATTPVGPWRLLAAQVLINTAIAFLMAFAVYAVGSAAFDVPLPANIPATIGSYLLACACVMAIGALISAVVPGSKVAGLVGSLVWFPLMFFAGLWIPLSVMPDSLATISRFTPLGAAADAMTDSIGGSWPDAWVLAVLAGYTLVFAALAVRLFRWR